MADEATTHPSDFPYYDLGPATSEALDLDAIKARALVYVGQDGTVRPWRCDEVGGRVWRTPILSGDDGVVAHCGTHMDAEFVAAVDPPTVLALVDALARVMREAEALRAQVAAVEAQHRRVISCDRGDCCQQCDAYRPCRTIAALATTGEGKR